jgi:TetR/AcrR family transcriptional repressor of nem operon
LSGELGKETEMPRPRAFALEEVLLAARDQFWENGYESTSLSDLEREMRLSRSSLYAAFGSKRALFLTALERYIEVVLWPLVEELEREPAGLDRIATFFSNVKRTFLEPASRARRGCLLVNTIVELDAEDEAANTIIRFRDRLRAAFAHSLDAADRAGDLDHHATARRASMLVAGAWGTLLIARLDPATSIELCDSIAFELDSWRRHSGQGVE